MGKVLFEETIACDLAQQVFARALALISSFGQVPAGSGGADGAFFIVYLKASGHTASVHFSALSGTDDSGPETEGLAGLLGQITHAF
jgi:subtilisin family serine protease